MMKLRMLVLVFMLGILSFLDVNAEQYHTTISNGRNYFYFIKKDGTLYRFSVGSDDVIFEKVMDNVVDVSGEYAVKEDGSMWSWDDTASNQFKITENVKDISSSESHTLILKKDNSLWGLGNNSYGQLAQGEVKHNIDSLYFKYMCSPVNFSEPVKIMDDVKCAKAGNFYSCVLKSDGSVWTFGCNHFGELGYLTDKEINNVPVRIFENANSIFSGEASGFVIDETNVLYRWGTNYSDSTAGIPSDISKVPVKYFDNAKYLSDMNGFNLMIKDDNTLWIYGGNEGLYDVPVKIADNVNCVSSMNEYGDEAIFLDMNGCMYLFVKNENNEDYTIQKIAENIRIFGENDILQTVSDKEDINLIIGGRLVKTNVNPIIINDRTLIPMRFLFEQMGATVDWDDTTKTATVKKGEDVISFSIDNIEATVNNSIKTMDVPARLINGKTLVPLRFLSEELGYNVEWDGDNRIVTISE